MFGEDLTSHNLLYVTRLFPSHPFLVTSPRSVIGADVKISKSGIQLDAGVNKATATTGDGGGVFGREGGRGSPSGKFKN